MDSVIGIVEAATNAGLISPTFKGKVVLITGASRGIEHETALQYAHADIMMREVPTAEVTTFVADVRDTSRAEEAIKATVAQYRKLHILVSNAGKVRAMDLPFASKNPFSWWDVVETNLRGAYNYVHFAVPELLKTKGQIVINSSSVAQLRIPGASEYSISNKYAKGRLAEYIACEHPNLKVFTLRPGIIETATSAESAAPVPPEDDIAFPAATFLHLTAGKAGYLSGRYFSANWDLEEVDRDWKSAIIEQHGLGSKLFIPSL